MPDPVVAVIGGGVSGLASAHRLTELRQKTGKNFKLLIFEGGSALGGVIGTEKKDGFLLEDGPDSFLREKPWAMELAARLGLEGELIGTRQGGRVVSYVFHQGRLLPIPEGFYLVGPVKPLPFLRSQIFSFSGKIRMLAEVFVPKGKAKDDESVASFVRRRFGQECLERAGQPMLAGIYTGDPEALGMRAALPRFLELEKKYGSVLSGLRQPKKETSAKTATGPRYGLFVSFRGGMQTLTDALIQKLKGETTHLRTAIKKVSFDPSDSRWQLVTEKGEVFKVDAVCLTLPARKAKALFEESIPALSRELSSLQYESVATVNFAYRLDQLKKRPDGFGFVVPATEKRGILACTFADKKFEGRAPEGHALLRAFVGGAFGRAQFEKSDTELLEDTERELRDILGIEGRPLFTRLQRYGSAMVQYGVGHFDWLRNLEKIINQYPGLYLAGNSTSGVGVPDCVHSAETQVEKIVANLR